MVGDLRAPGAAGEVAGSAVWLSFLLAGIVAALQGYSFAKFGARYPSAGGLLEYVSKGSATGSDGITAWLTCIANADRHRDGGGLLRQLRQLDVRRGQRGVDQGVRRPHRPGR